MTNAKLELFSDFEKLKAEKAAASKKCCIEGCESSGDWNSRVRGFYLKKGMCNKHYRRFKTHGDPNIVLHIIGENRCNHPLYDTYHAMVRRCNKPNNESFKNYGKRGITVCNEWLGLRGFDQFVKDMGEKPANHTLDRKDVNGNYSKENCHWATWHEQQANKQNNNKTVGVRYISKRNVWDARLIVDKILYHKQFKTEQEAINYRIELEKKYL